MRKRNKSGKKEKEELAFQMNLGDIYRDIYQTKGFSFFFENRKKKRKRIQFDSIKIITSFVLF